MNKFSTGLSTLIFSFVICFTAGITKFLLKEMAPKEEFRGLRLPANIDQCSDLINETVLFFRPPPGVHLWKRLTQSNFGLNDFSIERLDSLEDNYFRRLSEGSEELRPEASPEGLLAYIRASTKLAAGNVEEVSRISLRQTKALHETLKKLSLQRRFSLADIDDLSLELFTANFGPQRVFTDLFSISRRQRELIIEVASHDIARRGLLENFNQFRFLQANPGIYRRFGRSRFAKGLKVSLLNLPMLLGLPPLYLPKFRAPKMSQELSKELLEKGMTEEVYQKIQREIGSRLILQDTYQQVRKYYMYGVMLYLVIAQAYETYVLEQELEQTDELIQEAESEALEITGSIEVLERAGINVFSDELIEEGNIFCQNLKECFEAFSVLETDTESEGFKTCQDVIDPGNQCTSL